MLRKCVLRVGNNQRARGFSEAGRLDEDLPAEAWRPREGGFWGCTAILEVEHGLQEFLCEHRG